MRRITFIFIILVEFTFHSCMFDKYQDYKRLLYELVNMNDLYEINNIVIIPNEGCGGCISNTTHFFLQNNKQYKENTLVIFTGVKDYKQLRIDIGSTLLDQENIILDSNNVFLQNNVSSIYPQIINLKKGKIVSVNSFQENFLIN